jgi:hypothetical protein
MRKHIFFLYCLLLPFVLSGQQEQKLRVAVFDPSSSGTAIDEGTKVAVRELISSTFVNTGKYTIVERSLLDRVMKEQAFSNTDVVDESQATELGRLAGANKVVLSVVTLVGGRNMLSVKVIDVQTATVDQQKTKIVSSNDLLDVVEPLTLELLGEVAPETKSTTDRRTSPVADKSKVSDYSDVSDVTKNAANIITQSCKKPEKYNSDEEKFKSLKNTGKVGLERFIISNTQFPVEPTSVNENELSFFLRNRKELRTQWAAYIPIKVDDALLLFLDGRLIAIGMASTGFLVTLPRDKFEGRHNLSLHACTFPIFNMSVDLSAKNYFLFDWEDKKKVKQIN